MCAVAFRTTHGKNNRRECDTEGVVPIASLNGLVRSLSLFIISLIGRTGKIWSVIYINAMWIYTYETLACTIREWVIVRNVLYVTSNCPFISWCSRAANVKSTTWVWHYSLKPVQVNCFPASDEILSKSQHPNSSIFPDLDWNISS